MSGFGYSFGYSFGNASPTFSPDDSFHVHRADGTLLSGVPAPGAEDPKPTSPVSGRSTVTMVVREGGKIVLRPRDSGYVTMGVRAAGEITMYVRAR